MLKSEGIYRPAYAPMTLLKVLQTSITQLKDIRILVVIFLANLARTSASTAVWLASRPKGLASLCYTDCNF
jgi:hypothetical protein